MDIPLDKIVGIAGVSGSGKSSLALGVLYAEGSRRYLEALSTYTRRRMTQASESQRGRGAVCPSGAGAASEPGRAGHPQHVRHGNRAAEQPAAHVLPPRKPPLPERRLFQPTLAVAAAGKELVCPECGAHFYAPSAEELAFNSQVPCQVRRHGNGQTVDMASLVPDDSLTIDERRCRPWNSLMWSLMTDICREMGVGRMCRSGT